MTSGYKFISKFKGVCVHALDLKLQSIENHKMDEGITYQFVIINISVADYTLPTPLIPP